MVIQVLLIVGVVAVAVLLLRSQGSRHQAVRRILLVLFALAAITSILQPAIWSAVARTIGVGRGTDLLLYLLVIAFLSYVATRFAKDRATLAQITVLARRLALLEAGPPRRAVADDGEATCDAWVAGAQGGGLPELGQDGGPGETDGTPAPDGAEGNLAPASDRPVPLPPGEPDGREAAPSDDRALAVQTAGDPAEDVSPGGKAT